MIGLTGENLAMNRAFLVHEDPSISYPIAIGGAPDYAVTGVPYAVLVAADGKVAWEGSPGGLSDKQIEALLEQVDNTPGHAAAKADKRLAFAEKFAEDKLFARAEYEMNQIVKFYPGTDAAKKAAERVKELAEGEAKAELDAQKEIVKLVGGFEHPPEKMKGKEIEAIAKKLQKKAGELRSKAPRAAALAEDWANVFNSPWKDMKK